MPIKSKTIVINISTIVVNVQYYWVFKKSWIFAFSHMLKHVTCILIIVIVVTRDYTFSLFHKYWVIIYMRIICCLEVFMHSFLLGNIKQQHKNKNKFRCPYWHCCISDNLGKIFAVSCSIYCCDVDCDIIKHFSIWNLK